MAETDTNEDQVEQASAAVAEAGKETTEEANEPDPTPAAQPAAVEHPTYEFVLALVFPLVIMGCIGGLIWYHELTIQPSEDGTAGTRPKEFSLDEATIADIQYEFRAGRLSSRSLVKHYLDRIRTVDTELNSVLETNPDAFHIADDKDVERHMVEEPMGALHGIPVLLKDNIGTKDRLNTTAGSYALLGSAVPRDAAVVALLRGAGAVILGKSNMDEWAGLMATDAVMGWSARGGLTKSPYALAASPCGSSGGPAVAVAANLASVALGTETDGALLCPASHAAVVGLKPTVGLTSRAGLLPFARSQDSVGPIARTLEDAVAVLDVIVAREADPRDPATERCQGHIPKGGYKQFLMATGASKKRIGVARYPFFDPAAGLVPEYELAAHMAHVETLRELGAEIVDNANLEPSLASAIYNGTETFPETAEQTVLLHEFKADIEEYLEALEESPNGRTLADLIAFNEEQKEVELGRMNQELLLQADKTSGLEDEKYKEAKQLLAQYTRDGIDRLFEQHSLDAITAPTSSKICKLAAIAGYPGITVPAGYSPPGLDSTPEGVPFGLAFIGRACSEPALIEIAFAFEQATTLRKAPPELGTKTDDTKDHAPGSKDQVLGSESIIDGTSEFVTQRDEL